jgi:hypothetical protein
MATKIQRKFNASTLASLLGVVLILTTWLAPARVAFAATGAGCATSGPSSGSYSVTICFDGLSNNSSLSGDVGIAPSFSVSNTSVLMRHMVYYLDDVYLLTAYQKPYNFVLPTKFFPDGKHVLSFEAFLSDGFTTPKRASVSLVFKNGQLDPPADPKAFKPSLGTLPPPGSPFVLVAVGDGTSGENNETKVTDLISKINPNLILYLGDDYERGSPTEFYNFYGTGDQWYSRFRSITNPTPGNHDYLTDNAQGYFSYWDNIPSYYSFNVAGWHIVSINSNFYKVDTKAGSPQYTWLNNDLSSNTADCTIVYYHHPLFNNGPEGSTKEMSDMWSLFAQKKVALVLNGHDHDYQHWEPLDASGNPSSDGVTEFIVGTGGHGIQGFINQDPRMIKGYDTSPNAFGVLRFDLGQSSANFQFINIKGAVLDSGNIPCRGATPNSSVSASSGPQNGGPAGSQVQNTPVPAPQANNPSASVQVQSHPAAAAQPVVSAGAGPQPNNMGLSNAQPNLSSTPMSASDSASFINQLYNANAKKQKAGLFNANGLIAVGVVLGLMLGALLTLIVRQLVKR